MGTLEGGMPLKSTMASDWDLRYVPVNPERTHAVQGKKDSGLWPWFLDFKAVGVQLFGS